MTVVAKKKKKNMHDNFIAIEIFKINKHKDTSLAKHSHNTSLKNTILENYLYIIIKSIIAYLKYIYTLYTMYTHTHTHIL